MSRLLASVALVVGTACSMTAAGVAQAADCGVSSGSVRILSNDFDILHVIADAAKDCASSALKVKANQTTEHKSLQVPALTINPAEYTVAMVANNSIAPLLNNDLIRPLDDYIAKHGQQLEQQQLIKVNGKTMAIAFDVNSQHLYYRKDLLDEAGLKAPKTYEDILADAKVLRDKGILKYPLGAADKPGWDLAAEFENMYLGEGGAFFEPGSAKLAINNQKGLAALKMMKDLTQYMAPDFMTYDAQELKNVYLSGKIAIMNGWGSYASSVVGPKSPSPKVAKNTVLAAAPTVGGNDIPAAALWWDGFSISKNISDKDAEASFQVMMHAISPAVAKAHPKVAPWLVKGYEPSSDAVGVIKTAKGGAKPYPMLPYMDLLHTALGTEVAGFLQGQKDAQQTLNDVQSAYDTAAKEAGFLK